MTAAAFAGTTDWGTAIEVPGTAALNIGDAKVTAVSCASAGNCAAGGYYNSSRVFVVNETNGVWRSASAVAVPHSGYLNAISCATAGSCAAGGSYTGNHGHLQAFVVTESHGVWGKAIAVPGLTRLNSGGLAVMYAISCARAGFCAAGGTYDDGSAGGQAWVANEERGVWRKAIEVPGSAALNFGAHAELRSISCATANSCAAGGIYFGKGAGPNPKGFVVNEKKGVWGKAITVTGSRAFNHSSSAWVNTISCATARSCAAGGPGFVVSEKRSVWRKAVNVPGLVNSISCAKAGSCTAGGSYTDGSGNGQGFVMSEQNGIWHKRFEVPGSAALNLGGEGWVSSISCGTAGSCAAAGY
jgi:hypothetical protein